MEIKHLSRYPNLASSFEPADGIVIDADLRHARDGGDHQKHENSRDRQRSLGGKAAHQPKTAGEDAVASLNIARKAPFQTLLAQQHDKRWYENHA